MAIKLDEKASCSNLLYLENSLSEYAKKESLPLVWTELSTKASMESVTVLSAEVQLAKGMLDKLETSLDY